MKKATIAFFIFVFASLGYVAGYKEIKRVVYRKQLLPNMNFGKKVPHEEVTLQKRFVITIPSYRNAHLCEGNLRSVFEQKYDNYRVIYVDDGSPDGTYEKVKQIVTDFNQWHRFTLLKNETNRGAMYNHALMSEYYDNDEIVVMLDGDDRLASDLVLQELNRYYANPKVWVTYGQYITYPEYKVGLCKPMSFYSLKKGVVRDQQWVTSALRTFYGGLFRRINKEDFLYGDVFLPMACDLAYMFPIVEMAREHVYYTQDIGYIYHLNTGINDQTKSRSEQVFFEKFCRERPRYNALKEHPSLPIAKQKVRSTDVFIFAQQKPVELSATLESLVSHRNEIGEVCIFIDSDDDKVASGYERVKKDYPFARYVNENDLKESLSHILTRPGSTHVLLLSEGMIIDEDTKIKECAEDLEKSG
ncbi:MAG: glycosyltransferase family 2 protein, partial [Chlamydiae bacterium]|nr:glycosyltransferase family 2 protein [Chlamydiota bacterium]